MGRILAFVYGSAVYVLMFLTFLYLFAFLANILVPKTIDSGTATSFAVAFAINAGLIILFGVPHSLMARPAFKHRWIRIVPKAIERSTYVLVSTLLLILLFWQWRPMNGIVWQADAAWAQAILWGLYVLGIVLLFASTFVINHFDLFGLRQITLNLLNRPYTPLDFKVTFFYKYVRHPLYVGWFLIFWATPQMSVGHVLFAIGMSSYILVAIRFEERDLVTFHGQDYVNYQRKVPMLIPRPGKVHETVKTPRPDPLQTA
ncbi:MAG TPA: NnrU family protein [Gammaproteobacteria bacterium]|jgi:protein-S-isoprenylcysteine O-methyltransferase Ste14